MKILLINFPILDVGGISTWAENIIKGFQRNDIYVRHYYATIQRRFKHSRTEKVKIGIHYVKGEKLPSRHISYYHEDEVIKFCKKVNKKYDYCLFIHPGPHPTRGYLRQKNCENWKLLYKYIDIPKGVVFHDNYWHKTNAWFEDVKDNFDVLFASQKPHWASVGSFPNKAYKRWLYFPLDFEMCKGEKFKRKKIAISPAQWLRWKNHHLALPHLPDLKFPMHFYSTGMEYHKLRASGDIEKYFGYNAIDPKAANGKSWHKYFGFVTYDEFINAFKKSIMSVDFSRRGYNNYTHFEPMMFGCVSCTEQKVMENELCQIPEDCTYIYDIENMANDLNRLYGDKQLRKKIDKQARKWVKRFDCGFVANWIIKAFEKIK